MQLGFQLCLILHIFWEQKSKIKNYKSFRSKFQKDQMEGDSTQHNVFASQTQKESKSQQKQSQNSYTAQNQLSSQKEIGQFSQTQSGKMKSETQIEMKANSEIASNQDYPITEQEINQLKTIFAQFRDFKTQKQNKVQLVKPSYKIIAQVVTMWKKRTIKSSNFVLTLSLHKLGEQVFKKNIFQLTQIYASIKVIVDDEQIQDKKSIHGNDGNTYFEGFEDQFMMITKTNGNIVDYYEGQVKGKVQNGQGSLYHSVNGQLVWHYAGEFIDGKRQGHGKEVTSKGLTYEGQFKNDFKHGKGFEFLVKKRKHPQPNQDLFVQKKKYIGQFLQGLKQGEGTQTTSHGQYKGQWLEDAKQGKGKMTYKNGHSYQGEWINNSFDGEGVYIQIVAINGESKENKYSGQFKEGLYHGKGVMQYGNGDKYDGQWAFSKKQGQGMYEWADGDYYDGTWEKDSAQGTGAACFGGVFYDGQFHFGQKHGLGQQTDADGNTVKAIWQNNKILRTLQINGQIVEQDVQEN